MKHVVLLDAVLVFERVLVAGVTLADVSVLLDTVAVAVIEVLVVTVIEVLVVTVAHEHGHCSAATAQFTAKSEQNTASAQAVVVSEPALSSRESESAVAPSSLRRQTAKRRIWRKRPRPATGRPGTAA